MNTNPNRRKTFEIFRVNGTGKVLMSDYSVRDVLVYAYFCMWEQWWFIIHSDVDYPDHLQVSEASTGCVLNDEYVYETIEDALSCSVPFIEQKRYHFHTKVTETLVRTRKNLLRCNTTGLLTLALSL